MSASNHAQRERLELSDLLDSVGADAPTLCEGWTTRDLAAHLVVREARPDAALGVAGGPLSGWTDRVTKAEAQKDYSTIVEKVRTGPPLLSVFSILGAAGLVNLVEYVVHHEDVLRAQPNWQPRQLPDDLGDELWSKVSMPARRALRGAKSGVRFIRTDGSRGALVAHEGEPWVTVTGSALELLMIAFGRHVVDVTVDGDEAAVEKFRAQYL